MIKHFYLFALLGMLACGKTPEPTPTQAALEPDATDPAGFAGTYTLQTGQGPKEITVKRIVFGEGIADEYILTVDGDAIQGVYMADTKTFMTYGCQQGGYNDVIFTYDKGAYYLRIERTASHTCEAVEDENGMIEESKMSVTEAIYVAG